MKARLIGESSAGLTAVEIFDRDNNLVWSHVWFSGGASRRGYIDGLCAAWDCMVNCDYVNGCDGGAYDDDGEPIVFDDGATTGVMLEYNSDNKQWMIGDDARCLGGQSMEIVDACMIAGLIPVDDDHADHADDDDVRSVAEYIIKALTI
jgi:hypothetical protein